MGENSPMSVVITPTLTEGRKEVDIFARGGSIEGSHITRDVADLGQVTVAPGWRKNGIGTRMLMGFIAEAKERGATSMEGRITTVPGYYLTRKVIGGTWKLFINSKECTPEEAVYALNNPRGKIVSFRTDLQTINSDDWERPIEE